MVFPRRDIFCIRTTDWKSLPQHFEHCSTGLPFFDPLSSSIIPVCTLAIEFDSSLIVDLPEALEELKAENSARGLVATWIEGVASGWVRAQGHTFGSKISRLRSYLSLLRRQVQ